MAQLDDVIMPRSNRYAAKVETTKFKKNLQLMRIIQKTSISKENVHQQHIVSHNRNKHEK
jgi:hypothetical protein